MREYNGNDQILISSLARYILLIFLLTHSNKKEKQKTGKAFKIFFCAQLQDDP